ncbi:hypothetical protein BDZ97DRAFT_1919800 [Flammula alnicola]|nr:hypothetical protein BDZ97DRAFT_1919800 [Flammula alnicola]
MYWECNEHFFSEDGLHVEGRQSGIDPNTRELSLFGRKKQDLRDMWDVLVQGYGNRELTHPDKNKLVAISGLAQKFAKLLGGDEYIVGLWKKRLVESLFWSLPAGLEAHILPPWQSTWPPAHYRAPSWSWACLDAPIYNPDERIYAAEKNLSNMQPLLRTRLIRTARLPLAPTSCSMPRRHAPPA